MSVEKLALHRQMARVVSAALVSIPPYVLFQAPRFGDEMRDPYTMTARYGLNPLKIIRGNLLDVRPFLELGEKKSSLLFTEENCKVAKTNFFGRKR